MICKSTPRFAARSGTVLLIAAWFGLLTSAAQSGQFTPEKRVEIEAAVAHFIAANSVPGMSVAVVADGAEAWSAGFGSADLENFVPATSHTLLRLGSISKSITATAALLLWQQGKLDLDAPIQKYCPFFPQKDTPITTRELLGHLGGIRHYKEGSPDDLERSNTKHFMNAIEAGIDFFKNDPLVAKPGTEFHYSTQGYTLVGCVIEGVSGDNYVDYVRKSVLMPAGMAHTVSDDRLAIIPFRTRFYSKDKSGAINNADCLDSSYKIPGGGWLSSADDIAQFEVAMLNDRVVTRATRDLMWTPLKPADGKENSYALGWGTGKDLGVLDVGHGGGQEGTSTFFMVVPERRAGVVVLINLDGADASALAKVLMKIVLGPASAQPKELDNRRSPAGNGAKSDLQAALWTKNHQRLIRHHYRIDYVDHAVQLKHVSDRDHSRAALFVFQFDVFAVMQQNPQLSAFDCRQLSGTVALFNPFHQVLGRQATSHDVIRQDFG